MAETLLKDIRYALRWMARSPGFSAVAILSLGLGVGVNTAMFSLVDSLLFRPLPVSSPDTLVDVFTTGGDGDEYATSSYQDFLDLKSQNTVFTDMIGYSPMMAPLSLGDRSRIALGQVVTSNHFSMLAVQPFLGRLLVPSDDEPGAPRVVVLSHRMWQREYGGDHRHCRPVDHVARVAVLDRRRRAAGIHGRRGVIDAGALVADCAR